MAQRRVSIDFQQADVGEVLDWLRHQNVSFVVAQGMIHEGSKVTMNIVEQPVDDVADALAMAMGGHWARRNEIRIFQPGPGSMEFGPFGQAPSPQGFGGFGGMMPPTSAPPLDPAMRKHMEAFKTQMADVRMDGANNPEFRKQMEVFAKQMAAQAPKMAEAQKRMAEVQMEIAGGKDGKILRMPHDMAIKMMVGKDGKAVIVPDGMKDEDFDKEMAAAKAEIARIPSDKMSAEQKAQIQVQVKMAMDNAKKAREMAQTFVIQADKNEAAAGGARELAKAWTLRSAKAAKAGHAFQFDVTVGPNKGDRNIAGLLDSLTSDQKFTQRSRGYLFYRDLTTAQKKLLGPVPKSHFELKYNMNGQSLAIHG